MVGSDMARLTLLSLAAVTLLDQAVLSGWYTYSFLEMIRLIMKSLGA